MADGSSLRAACCNEHCRYGGSDRSGSFRDMAGLMQNEFHASKCASIRAYGPYLQSHCVMGGVQQPDQTRVGLATASMQQLLKRREQRPVH